MNGRFMTEKEEYEFFKKHTFEKEAKKAMELNGYNLIVENGWLLKKFKNGKKLNCIEYESRFKRC